jgi:hypothetical protein
VALRRGAPPRTQGGRVCTSSPCFPAPPTHR